ncbi:unknown [Firmicutes bacterium CAG:475]|nr:unknown [Firmicutes bacterium CAG:475]
MEKIDFTPYINDLQKGGAIIEKIQQGTATEEERIKAKELIWTIVCKILMKELLTDLPMQQKDLAKSINVKPTMISDYKKGKSMPSMPTLLMMLSILKPEMIYTLTNGKVSEVNETFKNLGVDLFM